MPLYLIVVILVIAGPFALSFEKNLMLYKRWSHLIPAILIGMLLFGIWDIIFTHIGCWVFYPIHNSGIYFFKLPLEEYLFFISIPYACAFSYYAFKFHFPNWKANAKTTSIITSILILASIIISITNTDRTYTFVNFLVLAAVLSLAYKFTFDLLQHYLAIFPILMVPFFIVNGILTGSGIEQEVFSYDPSKILGIHLLNMPAEDLFYACSLILTVLSTTEFLESKFKKTPS